MMLLTYATRLYQTLEYKDIFLLRYCLDLLVSGIITNSLNGALESCDLSSTSLRKVELRIVTIRSFGFIFEVVLFLFLTCNRRSSSTTHEFRVRNFSIRIKALLAKIVFVLPVRFFEDDRREEERKIDRLFTHATICHHPINGTHHEFEYCIDPREPPICDTISRRSWNVSEQILALCAVELVVLPLVIYSTVWTKWMLDRYRLRCELKHRSSNWWHRQIDSDRFFDIWHDHRVLITFLTECRHSSTTNSRVSFFAATIPVIDLNSSSDDKNTIDRLIYSMIIIDCKKCESDDGIYFLVISEFLRKYRLIKLSSNVPLHEWNRTGADIKAYVQGGLAMCVFQPISGERSKFLLYKMKDDWKREFDIPDVLELDGGCFWCLNDGDGLDMRTRKDDATYVRIIYHHGPPVAQFGMGFAIRQCLLDIPNDIDGEIEVEQLQGITYGSNWEFTNHYGLIRTSRGHVGVIGDLIDSDNRTTDDARWAGSVVYCPATRRLSAIADHKKYLFEIDPGLRKYFDRNLGCANVRITMWLDPMFQCPQILTDTRAIDVMGDGSIRSIDFAPRSLKWMCLRKLFDTYGLEFDKCRMRHWTRSTGVDLDRHFYV